VNRIIARLVPEAICGEKLALKGSNCRAGTMKTPPPMPSIAAMMPTSRATVGRRIISNGFVALSLLRVSEIAATD